MRKIYSLWILSLIGWAAVAQPTNTSLISLSVQIDPAAARAPLSGLEWNSSISSFASTSDPNHEMELADSDIPYTHQGFFIWTDPVLIETAAFPFALDVPEQGDDNNNGVADFFDPESATRNLRTSGFYQTPDGEDAEFTANWTRASGQTSGTLVLNFPDLGLRFTHDYRLLNYVGSFQFNRTDSQHFDGTIALTNVLTTNDVIRGPLSLTLTNNDTLGYTAGAWIQTGDVTNRFAPIDALDRIGTNFLSLVELQDGYPATPAEDYLYWFLLIRSSDTNANNIADLVETPSVNPASPTLNIARDSSGILITVHGSPGETVTVEESENVPSTWQTLEAITLAGDGQQTVQRPTQGARKFYRVRRN